MGWPIAKCLTRTGIPAATMGVSWTLVDVIRDGAAPADALVKNMLLYGAIWLVVAAFFWVVTRLFGTETLRRRP